MVVWKIAHILNKKDLSFWVGGTKSGSATVASACCMLAKSIFCAQQSKRNENQSANFQLKLKWHSRLNLR